MASDANRAASIIRTDFEIIRRNEAGLPAELYYLAGLCQTITGLQLKVLDKFLGLIGRAKRSQEVTEPEYFSLCLLVREGRLGDAKSALEACRIASMKSIREALPDPVQPKEDISAIVHKIEEEERRKEAEAKRQSESLARRLHKQYEIEVEQMAAEQARVNLACQKCSSRVSQAEGVRGCGHIFHRQCLESTLTGKIREGVYPLTCPVGGCQGEVTLSDMQGFDHKLKLWASVSMQGYQHYRVHSEPMVTCPTAGCSYRIFFQGQIEFYCPECGNRYCLRCRSSLHPGILCESKKPFLSTSDLNRMFEFAKMGVLMKACPGCMRWNIKPTHQQFLACLCGTNFCSKCGIRGNACLCQNLFA